MAQAHFDANPTLGSLLISALISCFLFGILSVQINFYYSKFSHDRPWLKVLVGFIWLMEFGHLVAVCYTVHVWTISDYGHPDSLAHAPHGIGVSILMSGLIAPLIQAYFSDRIRLLTKNTYGTLLAATLWVFAAVRFGFSMALAAEALHVFAFSAFETDFRWLIASTLAVGTVSDTLVCAVLFRYVKTRFSPNKSFIASVIDQIVAFTIRNGLVICLMSISVLVSFASVSNAFIWHSLFVVSTRLFSNVFLSSVNSRSRRVNIDPNSMPSEPSTVYTFSDTLSAPRFTPASIKEPPTMLTTLDPLTTLGSPIEEVPETESRRY